MKFEGTVFSARGEYERASLGLLATGGLMSSSGTKRGARRKVEYKGTIYGCTIHGTVTTTREEDALEYASLLGSDEDATKVLMILTEDLREFEVLERSKGGNTKFYRLTAALQTIP